MNDAAELAAEGAPEGTVVWAEVQSVGAGRRGRLWVSPPGGLYFSLILRPQWLPRYAPRLTLLAAVAVSDALFRMCSVQTRVKWPNDLFFQGQKIAGLLMQAEIDRGQLNWIILGVGINWAVSKKDLPEGGGTLRAYLPEGLSQRDAIETVCRQIERRIAQVSESGWGPVWQEWRRKSDLLGCRVSWQDAGRLCEGAAEDIDEDGGLRIRLDNGNHVIKMSGDIYHIRPASDHAANRNHCMTMGEEQHEQRKTRKKNSSG